MKVRNKSFLIQLFLLGGIILILPKFAFAKLPYNIIISTGHNVKSSLTEFNYHGRLSKRLNKIKPFPNSSKGLNIASGDVDADGIDEIIVSQRAGGTPKVEIYEQNGKKKKIEFWPYGSNLTSGINIASGDVNNDGQDEIITIPAEKAVSRVKIYKFNKKKKIIKQFKAFGKQECGGTVAAGDIDQDGKDEIIVGAGPKCSPIIKVFEKNGKKKPLEFYAFHPHYFGGIDIAAGDVDQDGKAEIAVCQSQNQTWCKVYEYQPGTPLLGAWLAYDKFEIGARVAMADLDSDGRNEIITGTAHGTPHVRAFESTGKPIGINFYPFSKKYNSGIDVTGFFSKRKSSGKVIYVDDGDSVNLSDGREIRYIGVNTPEVGKKMYKKAINYNKKLVERKKVILEYDLKHKDPLGRELAFVFIGKKFINKILVKKGLAKVDTYPPNTKYLKTLKKAQRWAKKNKKGIWKK